MLLNCHTFFSHTYGTIPTRQLAEKLAALGYASAALTDINNTCTSLDFVEQCLQYGVRPVLGIDYCNMDESARSVYIGLAENNEGFSSLNEHLSIHLHNKTSFSDTAPEMDHTVIIYPFSLSRFSALRANEYIGVRPQDLSRLHSIPEDILRRKAVALYPVSLASKDDYYLHCLLRAVGQNTLLSKLERHHAGERNEYLVSPDELQAIYRNYSYLLRNAGQIMDRCSIAFNFNENKNKRHFTVSVEEDVRLFREMCMKGLEWRYAGSPKYAEALERMEKEIDVVTRIRFVSYFLMAWDVVRYANSKGYFHAGRGSGANSIAAYCLGITEVDPIQLNLYFERFLNMHRHSPPDFDIDFSWKDKDDVRDYLFKRYGTAHTAMLGSHSTIKFRASMRELGKVYGLPKDEIDDFIESVSVERMIKPAKSMTQMDIYRYKMQVYGARISKFPRHLSVHSSGIVISENRLFSYTATDLPPKGFPNTHFDMYTAEKFKLFKLDILSQRGLGHIKDCISLISQNRGEKVDIHQTDRFTGDPRLNKLLSEGDTIGCFYIESPAMRQLLRKLQCDNFNTLVAASSIIRPGVSDSGMARTYVQRSREPDKYKPVHPKLDEILGETYGVMVYQEDIIKVANEFADISLANADLLRRAMAWKFRVDTGFEQLEAEYYANCRQAGYPETVIEEVWRQMEGFAGFSFCKAHSASYAVESYQSLFLKTYYPLEFMVAVINNFGGYYNTEFYINELRRNGGVLHAPCVNRSSNLTGIEGVDVYLGFIHVKSLEEKLVESLLADREMNGPFLSLLDFWERLHCGLEQLLILVRIGGFRFTGKSKRQLLWEACMIARRKAPPPNKPLFPNLVKEIQLPPLEQSFRDDALEEVELLGFPLCSRFDLLVTPFRGHIKASDLMNNVGKDVTMVGYLTNSKHKQTAKGDYMQFGSFLDDEGHTFEAVLFPQVYRKFPLIYKALYALTGKVTEDYGVATLELHSWEQLKISFSNDGLPAPETTLQTIAMYH